MPYAPNLLAHIPCRYYIVWSSRMQFTHLHSIGTWNIGIVELSLGAELRLIEINRISPPAPRGSVDREGGNQEKSLIRT